MIDIHLIPERQIISNPGVRLFVDYVKRSWKKEKRYDIPVEVMEKIAARGSFVVVKSRHLFREIREPTEPAGGRRAADSGQTLAEQINTRIRERNFRMWMENTGENCHTIRKFNDISEIPKAGEKNAVIVGAGPSFREKNHASLLREIDRTKLDIISTDRMLVPLLEEGIVPDLVVTADGHRQFIAGFYTSDLIKPGLKTIAVLPTMVAPNVVTIFPGEKYFFTPMIDDVDEPLSLSSAIASITGTTVLATGGNVGITSIFLAYYLKYRNIVLTGMDQGYTENTPVDQSQYYPVVKEADPTMTPERYREVYIIEGYNPDFNMRYYTDITWKAHIDHILEESVTMARNGTEIINATEGGSIHGGAVRGMTLREALRRYG